MFLVEPNLATDWQATKGMIETIMDRAQAQLLACRLWDEKRLAYDIAKHKRAAYILCYFHADGANISRIERDVQLSEHLLRVLVLRADHVSPEELEKIKSAPEDRAATADLPDESAKAPTEKPAVPEQQTKEPATVSQADLSESPQTQDPAETTPEPSVSAEPVSDHQNSSESDLERDPAQT